MICVPILATSDPAAGTNVSVKIEIVATGASLKVHQQPHQIHVARAPIKYDRSEDFRPIWRISGAAK
jgi:hypothetical protein